MVGAGGGSGTLGGDTCTTLGSGMTIRGGGGGGGGTMVVTRRLTVTAPSKGGSM